MTTAGHHITPAVRGQIISHLSSPSPCDDTPTGSGDEDVTSFEGLIACVPHDTELSIDLLALLSRVCFAADRPEGPDLSLQDGLVLFTVLFPVASQNWCRLPQHRPLCL